MRFNAHIDDHIICTKTSIHQQASSFAVDVGTAIAKSSFWMCQACSLLHIHDVCSGIVIDLSLFSCPQARLTVCQCLFSPWPHSQTRETIHWSLHASLYPFRICSTSDKHVRFMTQQILCNINISRKKVHLCLKIRLFKRTRMQRCLFVVNLMFYSLHLYPLKQHKAKPIWSGSELMFCEPYSSFMPHDCEINESRDYFHF